MIKKCVICGKAFTPRYNLEKSQKLCGDPVCIKEYRKKYRKEYNKENTQRRKNLYVKKHQYTTKCKICGMPTKYNEITHGRPQYHEECVVLDCLETLKAGEKLTSAQVNRLYARGFEVKELKMEIENGTENL